LYGSSPRPGFAEKGRIHYIPIDTSQLAVNR
jgi:hypothetical protein